MNLNIYDFDGTIYDGDSSVDFFLFCLKKKVSIIKYVFPFLIYAVLYKLGIKTKTQMKEKFFKFLSSFKNIDDLVLEFWKKNDSKIKKFYLNENHENDVIISASPYFLLKPICDKLKVKDLIASDVDIKTGKFNSSNCHGKEKVVRFKEKYPKATILNAYSDNLSDKPILEAAKCGYLVEKDKIQEYEKNKKRSLYDTIMTIIFNSAIQLLVMFAIILIITSTCWLIKIPLSVIIFPLSFIISIIILNIIRKEEKIVKILAIVCSLLVIVISILIANNFYDLSYDGNAYHKEAIIAIDKGWNPIYEDYVEFCDKNNLTSIQRLWVTSYPKATWMIADSIYKITSNIESGKSINLMMIYITFSMFSYLIYKLFSKKVFNLILSFLIAFNPIVISQIFSYYLDSFMGLIFFLVVMFMALYVMDDKNKTYKLILASSIIIIINCKFTGLAYAGLFCLGYYIYYLYKKIKEHKFKDIKSSIVYFTITVLIALLLVGSNTYVKNLIDYKNPFYPLMGENKVDIMTSMQPPSFNEKSPIKKNFYSIFSKALNTGKYGEPVLKPIFTFSVDELYQFDIDTRISGYGVLFSGIFVISMIIISIYFLFNLKKEKIIFIFIPLAINVLLLFFLSDGWWARYSPWLYLFIIIALGILMLSKKKIFSILFIIYALLIFCNNSLNFYKIYKQDIKTSNLAKEELKKVQNKEIEVYFTDTKLSGIRGNLNDNNIKYEVLENEIEDMKPLYSYYVLYKLKDEEN